MKYLYILKSTPKDYYYEQFLLSASSLKLVMPDAHITLLCDTNTKESLTGKRSEYEKHVNEIITVAAPAGYHQIEISMWLKSSMRRFVTGDFLFIDCDTIITEDLSSIGKQGIIFGACLDCHSLIDRHANRDLFIECDKKLGFSSYLSNKHFNSGVIYCVDTGQTQNIFNRWNELWLFAKGRNILRDQQSFNMAIYENRSFFTELDGTWNCQLPFNWLPYLANSKIIHYFASNISSVSSPFLLASDGIFTKIKETGSIPGEVMELLKNPKSAFASDSKIVADKDVLFVINSHLFKLNLFLYKKMPFLFNFINRLSSVLKNIARNHLVRSGRKKDGPVKYYN